VGGLRRGGRRGAHATPLVTCAHSAGLQVEFRSNACTRR
jgi:hypothetical protein